MEMPKLSIGPLIQPPKLIPNVYESNIKNIAENVNLNTEAINNSFAETRNEFEKKYQDRVNREERIIQLLESIDRNTSALNDVLNVLQDSKENQEEILEIISQFNTLATINNKDEAQSLYRKIMNRINLTLTDVNSISTLCSYGLMIYNALKSMGKI